MATPESPSAPPPRRVTFSHVREEIQIPSNPPSSLSSPKKGVPSPFISLLKSCLNFIVIKLGLLLFLIFTFGAYDYLRNVEAEKCAMTWMFEYPHYVKLEIDPETDQKYPMYGLYGYAEGKKLASVRQQNFNGIPVLFLPGNAGSNKQVRSFASVALWKGWESGAPFHFDFFSIDFNEEMSGLYGYILERQVEYTRLAIEKITSYYEDYHQVVLLGHSMGGMIARAVNIDKEPLVSLLYTFATPHLHPILVTDPEIDLFYHGVNKRWGELRSGEAKSRDGGGVTLVSIAGGERDFLVPEKYTSSPYADVHLTATKIPDCWASTHHLSIVWCKQLVLATVRSLFDLVEFQKRNNYYSITGNWTLRREILNYHYVKRSSGKSFLTAHPPAAQRLEPPPQARWEEILNHRYCLPPSNSKQTVYIMFPMLIIKEKISGLKNDNKILLSTWSTGPKSWVYGCKAQIIQNRIRYCSDGVDLSHMGAILPSYHRRKKIIHLDYAEVEKYSHLLVKMDQSNVPLCTSLEVYNEKEREISSDAFEFTSHGPQFYNITIPFGSTLRSHFAWRISLQRVDLGDKGCEKSHHNSIGIFQHGNFQIHRFFKNESLIIRLTDWKESTGNALLYLEPNCKYIIKKEFAELETAGQIFRNYIRLLPAYLAGIFLMSLYFQDQGNSWKNPLRILISNAYYLTILPGFAINFLLWTLPNDYPIFLEGARFTPFLPIICFLVSYVIGLILLGSIWVLIYVLGKSLYGILIKVLRRKICAIPARITEYAFELTFSKLPVSLAALLVSLAVATTGELGLVAALALFLIKMFKRYESLLEELLKGRIKELDESLSHVNFQLSLTTLWTIITALNLPSLIHWVKNFGFGSTPQWDLSFYISLILLPTISVLWQGFVPLFNQRLWNVHRYMYYIMGLCTIIWGTHRLYIISFVCSLAIVSLGIIQLLSTMMALSEHQAELSRQEEELLRREQELEERGTEAQLASATDTSSEEEGSTEEEDPLQLELKGTLSKNTTAPEDSDGEPTPAQVVRLRVKNSGESIVKF